MAGTSKYIQIHEQILIEYIYTDQSSPEQLETDDFKLEILTNGHSNVKQLFSSNSAPIDMGNIRDRSVTQTSKNKSEYVLLDKDLPISYNDFDPLLTNSVDLEQEFSPELMIEYDSVRIHFISGFNFDDYDGFIFEITGTRKDKLPVNLTTLLYRKTDNYQTLNPAPILVGERLYSSYIDLKIPALYYFAQDDMSNSNSLGARLTATNTTSSGATSKGKGFLTSGTIDINLMGVSETYKDNGFTYFKTRQVNFVSLNTKDNFNLLVARIQESEVYDYYEMYGEYNGIIFEDFINSLNNQPDSNYIVFHEYRVSEQIGESFIDTSQNTILQTDDWDKPMLFRPIILNSSVAVAYSINYTMRLINQIDNSQIIKSSQIISAKVKKYGRLLPRINMGKVPTVVKVYNKQTDNSSNNLIINTEGNTNLTSTEMNEKLLVKKEFVNLFRDRINVKVNVSKVDVKDINITEE